MVIQSTVTIDTAHSSNSQVMHNYLSCHGVKSILSNIPQSLKRVNAYMYNNRFWTGLSDQHSKDILTVIHFSVH